MECTLDEKIKSFIMLGYFSNRKTAFISSATRLKNAKRSALIAIRRTPSNNSTLFAQTGAVYASCSANYYLVNAYEQYIATNRVIKALFSSLYRPSSLKLP